MDDGQRLELAQKLLAGSLKKSEIKDEMYMQLLKQTRGNPDSESCFRAWTLFHLLAASMPPSKVSIFHEKHQLNRLLFKYIFVELYS